MTGHNRWLRASGLVTVMLLVAAGLTAGSVPNTAVAATPTVRWLRSSTSFTTAYATYSYTYDRPVISGVSGKIAAAVDNTLVGFFTAAISELTTHDASLSSDEIAGCRGAREDAVLDGTRTSTTIAAIYHKRYLSVHVGWWGASCDTPMGIIREKYVNVDLKTGKPVKLSKFVDDRKDSFAFEIGAAMSRSSRKAPDGGFGDAFNRRDLNAWRSFDGWAASSSGVWVYYSWEGDLAAYLVPWERILKPGSVKGRTTTSYARYVCSDTTYRLRVTVRGGLVTVVAPDKTVQYGVRGTSRTILVHDAAGELDGNGDMIRGELTFASATSKRAVAWSSLNYC